jgi:hypothetical protein
MKYIFIGLAIYLFIAGLGSDDLRVDIGFWASMTISIIIKCTEEIIAAINKAE